MKKFERTALLVLIAGIGLLLLIAIFGSRRPIRATCLNSDCTLVNPYAAISLKFSKAVDADLVSRQWQTEPAIEGHWEWPDERHATWYADTPLPGGTHIKLMLQSGIIGKDGRSLSKETAWTIVVRNPLILTLQTLPEGGQEVFTTKLDGSTTSQLTYTNGHIIAFEPSPDGAKVAYSVENDTGGLDLWLIDRDGSDNHKIINCSTERCVSPAWSPSSSEIAYARETGVENGSSRIWLLDINSGETAPLFEDKEKNGYDPHWSPDGIWLTYWNAREGGIQVIRRATGETQFLESYNGDTGCWSADSRMLYYANTNLGETAFRNVIMKANNQEGTIETILSGEIDGSGLNYDNPACSKGSNLLAISVQPNTNIPGKELAVIDMDTMEKETIINDLTRIPTCYEWTAAGDLLVFQLNAHNADQEEIEIWVWDVDTQQASIILQNARSPAWLP